MHGHYHRTMCNERRTATIRYHDEQPMGTVSGDHIGNAQPRRCKGESAFKSIGTNTTNILNVQQKNVDKDKERELFV